MSLISIRKLIEDKSIKEYLDLCNSLINSENKLLNNNRYNVATGENTSNKFNIKIEELMPDWRIGTVIRVGYAIKC